MTTLFVSDLHLDAARPAITELFGRFLREEATKADALYLLGDLFEAWLGDDDDSATGKFVAARLREVRDAGVPIYFIRGNRDFLVGAEYAKKAGFRLLPDPAVVTLYGKPVLLLHGDLLNTDDTVYMQARAKGRNPAWQKKVLALPLFVRKLIAAKYRRDSYKRQKKMKADSIATFEQVTDVTPQTVEDYFIRYGVDTMIHGHTHRPAIHELHVEGRVCKRIVLGDWYEQGSVLRVDADGMKLEKV